MQTYMHLPPFWEDCKTSPAAGLTDVRVIPFARQESPLHLAELFSTLILVPCKRQHCSHCRAPFYSTGPVLPCVWILHWHLLTPPVYRCEGLFEMVDLIYQIIKLALQDFFLSLHVLLLHPLCHLHTTKLDFSFTSKYQYHLQVLKSCFL